MGRALSVGKVFFPLDEELELLPGNLAPRQQEHLVHLACFMPFDKVAEMMDALLGVVTNEETVRRHTEQVGSWMEAWQTAEVEAESSPESERERLLQRCVFSSDGAMVSLVHKQWAEVRTVAIGEPQERRNAKGEVEIHVGKLSYFSRLADASTFTRLAEVEMRRRRVREAKEVSAVMDGADWCQMFTDKHRPDAVRVLDFPHAGEHITQLLEALEKAKVHFPPQMLEHCLHILKHRGPHPLLRMTDRMPKDLAQQKGVHEHLDYLRKREALMQYPQFQRDGWPIGSGMVESANKNVVEARLKGTGMHWERKNVNPMLALRNAVCNGRWREMWQKAVLQHRKLQARIRSARVEQRAQALLTVGNSSSQETPSQSAAATSQMSPPVSSQAVSGAETPPVPPSLPVSEASSPSSYRLSSRLKQHTAHNRVKYSHQRSGNEETCVCGKPLVRLEGSGRTKEFCSNACRQYAYRQRQKHFKPLFVTHASIAIQPSSTRPPSAHIKGPPQASGSVSKDICPCGTPLVQSHASQSRRYCSDACRQRAYRERQAKAS
jgi:hypothetical protein